MISSINSNSDQWYLKSKNEAVNNIILAATKKQTNQVTESASTSDSSDSSDASNSASQKLTSEEFMKMMQSGKKSMQLSSKEDEDSDTSEYDTDGDGTISADEYEAMISQLNVQNAMSSDDFFAKYDTDGNGEISSDEMSAVKEDATTKMRPMGPPPEEKENGIPSEYDTDGDGSLSTDEYEAMMSQLNVNDAMSSEDFFTKYDADGNGEISNDEMSAINKNAATTSSSTSTKSLEDETSANEELGSLSDIDTDGDGSISTDELAALALNTLKAYENNYDYMFEEMEGSSLNSIA